MRIVYVGNFGPSFSTESHVALSLESLGHEVIRLQENEVDWSTLAEQTERAGADFWLHTHTHGYADESTHDAQQANLDALREAGIPSVAYHLDKWWGLEREHQVYEPFFRCDIVCTADGGHDDDWARIGVNHVWMPPAVVHTEVGRGTPLPRDSRRDVGFVGSWREYGHAAVWPWRFELVSNVWNRYGSRFRSYPRNGQAIRGQALNDLYASLKVVLGDSCLAGGATHYWSDRVPETIGRGGFLLHPDVPGLPEAFPTGVPITYTVGDLAEVYDLIGYWTDPARDAEREERIDEGIQWVAAAHTYRVRMAKVVEMVEGMR